ncbi:RGG repeats nuclear RNA binding protein A-like [Cucurbita pepo subsp. pepo]|uniref:RGG repeats nuclear RNA binding protein A-like n=1 Tax=Cucurbita pepo subsp. pepo TaxID=3664 RepID=UPI000C9D41D8|nr:RGG repeats nuclear RNA binding protein A-like [Cucurbita pepo subsp. pepo]
MATTNPFDLLGDDDAEDPSQLIAAKHAAAVLSRKGSDHPQGKQAAAAAKQNKPANLPSKPLPPAQAVREAKNEGGRGGRGSGRGGGGYGYGRGRGSGGFNREFPYNDYSFSSNPEDGETGRTTEKRGGYGGPRGRGGRRGGFNNGEASDGERFRGAFERQSGTGYGNDFKREGSGRGNWGRSTDEFSAGAEEVNEIQKKVGDEKPVHEDDENSAKQLEEKEPEDKEMTLEEYEKLQEEKRKALLALKTEERKVDPKEFASMQQLSSKKDNQDVFIKLGSDKDKRKEIADKEERTKKSLSINEFLKPAEGERHYMPVGRGRGRGRGSRGGYVGSSMNSSMSSSVAAAPSIEDPGQFPTLGGK